jgi:NitT/TauT family transport system permease protein
MRDLFRLQGAGRLTVLLKLQFPAASPAIFTGLRISAGLSVVGALVGDFFFQRGEPGLGSLISTYQATLRSAELFVAIIVACLFGLLVFIASGVISRRLTSRWYDGA